MIAEPDDGTSAVFDANRSGQHGGSSHQYYPAMLDLRGRKAVVIGGGTIATTKARELIEAGAQVLVISPVVSTGLTNMERTGALVVKRRTYHDGDLEHAVVAIAATDDRSVNQGVWLEANRRNVLLNAVDDVQYCHFIAPSVHREGDITVTVSTAGDCPALAVRLREQLSRFVRREHAEFAHLAGTLRDEVARRVPEFAARRRLWYRLVDSCAIDAIRIGQRSAALAVIESLVAQEESDAENVTERDAHIVPGSVAIVGAGPGDPGLITVRGLELLQVADVVVHDNLVSPELLARARPTARLVAVGKIGHGASTPQSDINTLLIYEARRGNRVVRLKGGDPFVFGRGAEEAVALREAGVTFEVVPGITSAIAVPAAAGIPLTHRAVASGFAVVTGHVCDEGSDEQDEGNGETRDRRELDWNALAKIPTLVVLMGLRSLPEIVSRLIVNGRDPDTPAAVISRGTLPDQRVVSATLASISMQVAAAKLRQPATLVVGDVVSFREVIGQPCFLTAHSQTELV